MKLQAMIFDLDGVITDTAEYHYQAWQRLADEEGLHFNREINESLRGVSRRASLDIILAGRALPEERIADMMRRKNDAYVAMLENVTPNDLLPGALTLLQELRGAGIKTALGSASRNAHEVIERLGILSLFDAVADGYSVERTKPAPDLFLHAAQELGVPPAHCAVVEDAAAGIEAAHAGGMLAIGVGPAERVGDADLIFADLSRVHLNDIVVGLAAAGAGSAAPPAPPDTWVVTENRFEPQEMAWKETVFTTGNGYLGTRGTFEEGYPGRRPVTLVHGVFDDIPIVFTELANAPNWLDLQIVLDGAVFRLDLGEVLAYERSLDLRNGVLARSVRWRSPAGQTVALRFERFASLVDPHLLLLRCTLTSIDFDGTVEVRAGLDGQVSNEGTRQEAILHWQFVDQANMDSQSASLHVRTGHTGIELGMGSYLGVSTGRKVTYARRDCAGHPGNSAAWHLQPHAQAVIVKAVTIYSSRDVSDAFQKAQNSVQALAPALVRDPGAWFEEQRAHQAEAWQRYWDIADIQIEGDPQASPEDRIRVGEDQQALRYNVFQLLIAASPTDDRVSIGAKTLSGFGYRGHVFWDTEIFILPFFTLVAPHIARNLLLYRYHTLAGARRKAQQTGYVGAMFAWESALTGDEVTPRWVPSFDGRDLVRIWCGDIELHITADVTYAVWQYWQATHDEEFFAEAGAELILDTACFWGSRAEWNASAQRYDINDVIGPDEYHERVNNSVFTNRMARWNLETAFQVLDWLRAERPAKAAELGARLDLTPARLTQWQDVIQKIYINQDVQSGLIEQFEGFFDLTDVDLAALEPRTRSVQALLGIEATNRSQVLKQADVIMLLTLLSDEYSTKTKRSNWNYYVPRTDHTYGSSLGPAIHAIMACELGDPDAAYEHFRRAARVDLADVRGNAADGIHGASAGGLWQAAVFGFGGLRVREDGWTIQPRLPSHWRSLRFQFVYHGERVDSAQA